MKYRLADDAPPHYVQGCGIVKGGGEFEYEGSPPSEWCIPVEVKQPPASKKARRNKVE